MTTTLIQLRNALTADGWAIRRTSKAGGKVSSVYLYRRDQALGDDSEIRISDHALGCNAGGERQGGKWQVDVVVEPALSLDDHLMAIACDDYRDAGDGFGCGYSYAEWKE